MEYKMRRQDRQLGQEEARQILKENQYGVLSLVGEDGIPYGVPLSYAYQNGRLYFHGAMEGRKREYFLAHPRASFCVVGKTEVLPEKFSTRYESVIAEGMVKELDGEEKVIALSALIEKYSSEFREKGDAYIQRAKDKTCVFCMEIEAMSGKARR